MAQMALVVDRPTVLNAAQSKLFEQRHDFDRVLAGQRQVVRAERTRHAGDAVAAAVAAGRVFEIEELHVVEAGLRERSRTGEPCDARADDDDAGATLHRRLRPLTALRQIAQSMAAFMRRADPAAGVRR